uniref:Uncharacterized protein n=1 Tax=Plectus sambesii TaxID=2011161 RepID=A0A914WC18_9BILA
MEKGRLHTTGRTAQPTEDADDNTTRATACSGRKVTSRFDCRRSVEGKKPATTFAAQIDRRAVRRPMGAGRARTCRIGRANMPIVAPSWVDTYRVQCTAFNRVLLLLMAHLNGVPDFRNLSPLLTRPV